MPYTPGPWHLHPRVKEDAPHVYHDGCIVATVETSSPERGEREANARLIAAAPDLLTLVQRATSAESNDWTQDDADRWQADARAAIAKATGAP